MPLNRTHKSLIVFAALALPVSGSALAEAKVYRALDGDRVRVITMGGKPPFPHRVVKVSDLSAAELERFRRTNDDSRLVAGGKVGEKIRIVDRSGKPPYTQRVVTVTEENAAMFARFEETQSDPAERSLKVGDKVRVLDRSGKPPYAQKVVTVTEDNVAELERAAATALPTE